MVKSDFLTPNSDCSAHGCSSWLCTHHNPALQQCSQWAPPTFCTEQLPSQLSQSESSGLFLVTQAHLQYKLLLHSGFLLLDLYQFSRVLEMGTPEHRCLELN